MSQICTAIFDETLFTFEEGERATSSDALRSKAGIESIAMFAVLFSADTTQKRSSVPLGQPPTTETASFRKLSMLGRGIHTYNHNKFGFIYDGIHSYSYKQIRSGLDKPVELNIVISRVFK